jgi:phage shock protein C
MPMAVHVPSRLYRSRTQKMIAGVSGGLGEYFDVDPVLIRLLFVVTTFVSGVGLLAYVVLWIVVPLQGNEDTPRVDSLRRDFDDLSSRIREQIDPRRPAVPGEPPAGAAPTDAHAGARAGATAGTASGTPVGFASESPTTPSASTAGAMSGAPGTRPTDEAVTAPLDPLDYDPILGNDPAGSADPLLGGRDYGAGAYGADAYGPRASEPRAYEAGAAEGPGVSSRYEAPVTAADRTRRRQHWAGAILIVLGSLFLAQNLGLLWWVHARFIWPLVLVGIGAWLLFGRGRRG